MKLLVGALLVLGLTAPAQTFTIRYSVTTARPTNVAIRVHVWCSRGEEHRSWRWTYRQTTPVTTQVLQPLEGATRCNIRVVAWDIPPWNPPWQGGQRPVVHTSVEAG